MYSIYRCTRVMPCCVCVEEALSTRVCGDRDHARLPVKRATFWFIWGMFNEPTANGSVFALQYYRVIMSPFILFCETQPSPSKPTHHIITTLSRYE